MAATSDPPSASGTNWRSQVRKDLSAIGERFEAADRRARAAAFGTGEPDALAEAERREAAGEFWAAGQELADLLLLLLRYATDHRREALQLYLSELLLPPAEPASDVELLRLLRGLERSPDALRALRRLLNKGGVR